MLVEKYAVKRNQCLLLLIVKFISRVVLLTLGIVNFDILALDHTEASVDTFDFCDELFLRDRTRLRLLNQLYGLISVYWSRGVGRRLPRGLRSGSSGRYTEILDACDIRSVKGTRV